MLGPQDFGGVKPQELLALLLLARGHPVSKETLADHLWPEQAPKNVAGTLETYVSVLRKKLFADRDQARQVLATNAGAYRFATDHVTLDIDLFDDLVARADMPGNDQLRLRTQAVDLVRGELLEDFRSAPWAHAERELYRDRITRVHVLTGEDLLCSSAFMAAIGHAESALKIRPYAEEAYRILMLANHALGHSESARLTFARCRSILGDELGHDPTSETADLASAIDAGVPAADLIAARSAGGLRVPSLPAPGSADRRAPNGRLPYFGRREPLEVVAGQIRESRRGQLRLVLIRGRSAMGRTALLDHLYESTPGLVGVDTYTPLDRELPPLPLARSISHALHDGSGAIDAAQYAHAPLLSESLEALQHLSRVLRQHSPMVLLLDDIHHADRATFAALRWLRRTCPELPLTVVVTARDLCPHSRHLDTLDLLEPDEEIVLEPLSVDELPDMDGFDTHLVQVTGGVPGLLADHWRWCQAGGSGPSPSLRDTVLRSVRGLGDQLPQLLQSICHLPQPFDLTALDAVSPLPPGQALSAIDTLCDLGFLDRVGRSFIFQAPIVREIICTTTRSRRAHPSTGSLSLSETSSAVSAER